jgi:hypothetical protein
VRLQRGDLTIVAVRVESLKAVATDVAALTEALAILGRRAGVASEEQGAED